MKVLLNIFPFRRSKLNTTQPTSDRSDYDTRSRSSLSSSSKSGIRRRLSPSSLSKRKVNRSQAKKMSSGSIISSLQALRGVTCDNCPPIDFIQGTEIEYKANEYAISVASLTHDESSPYKIDITVESLESIDTTGNTHISPMTNISNHVEGDISRMVAQSNAASVMKTIVHLTCYLFVLYFILSKIFG